MNETQVISDDLLMLAEQVVNFFENGGKFEDVYHNFNHKIIGLNIVRSYEISRLKYLKNKIIDLQQEIGELLLSNEALRLELEKGNQNGSTTK